MILDHNNSNAIDIYIQASMGQKTEGCRIVHSWSTCFVVRNLLFVHAFI